MKPGPPPFPGAKPGLYLRKRKQAYWDGTSWHDKAPQTTAPSSTPPGPVRARGRLMRYISWAVWLIPVFIAIDANNRDPAANEWLFWSAVVAATGALLFGYYRSARCGVDADVEGVTIIGFFRTRRLSWAEVQSIDFDDLKSEAGAVYHQLAFNTRPFGRVKVRAPYGGIEPGEYLYELRERLYALRDASNE